MNTFRKRVSMDTLFAEYAKILNGVLQLSEREVEVFLFLLKVDSEGERNNINSKVIRKRIEVETGIAETNLSRYLGVLKEHGLIVRGPNGKWVLNERIRPEITVDPETAKKSLELKFLWEVE